MQKKPIGGVVECVDASPSTPGTPQSKNTGSEDAKEARLADMSRDELLDLIRSQKKQGPEAAAWSLLQGKACGA